MSSDRATNPPEKPPVVHEADCPDRPELSFPALEGTAGTLSREVVVLACRELELGPGAGDGILDYDLPPDRNRPRRS